ncbi:hypothetical protein, partial [Enterobacter hormaechei]|uniref:hypothetical protein n=1 Tax=Enterobacter hormaechei TaxID=158836 RepID=UPI00203EE7BA
GNESMWYSNAFVPVRFLLIDGFLDARLSKNFRQPLSVAGTPAHPDNSDTVDHITAPHNILKAR